MSNEDIKNVLSYLETELNYQDSIVEKLIKQQKVMRERLDYLKSKL